MKYLIIFILFAFNFCSETFAQSMYMSQQRTADKDRIENLNGSGGVLLFSKQSDLVITVTNALGAKITAKGISTDGYYEYNVIISPTETRNPKIEINKRGDIDKIDFVAKTKPNFYTAYIISEVAKPIRMEDQTKANDIITDASLAQVEINSPISDLQFVCPKALDANIKTAKKANDQSITITTITFPVQPLIEAKAAVDKETEALAIIDNEIRQEFMIPTLNDEQRKQLSLRRDQQADLLNKAEEQWGAINNIVVYAEGTNQLVIDISEAAPRRKFSWGILLREGKVVEKGIESLQAGDPTTMLTQAKSYEQGTGAYTKDLNQALFWFEKAAEAGNIEAQEHLADVLFNGSSGYSPDYDKAFRWNTICANRNNLSAMRCLATLYEKGQGCQINKKEAIKWLLKYNKSTSDAEAQLQLALIYGIDSDEGISWLKRAADNGNAEAMARYAANIINTDAATGEIYYKRSVEKGYSQGKYEWGKILAKGSYGITKNSFRARILFKEAAQSGIKEAEYELSSLDLSLSNDSTIASLSAQIPELHDRAKHGDANAMYILYFLYNHKKDYDMANRMAFCVLYNHMHGNDWHGKIYKKSYGDYYGMLIPKYLKETFHLRGEDMGIYTIFYNGSDVAYFRWGIPHVLKYFIKDDIGVAGSISEVAGALKASARFGILLSNKIRAQISGYLKDNKSSFFKDDQREIKKFMKSYDWLFTDRPDTASWVQEYIDAGYLNPDNKNRRLQYAVTNKDPNDPEAQYKRLQDNVAALEKAAANYDGDALIKLYITYKILGKYNESFANQALSLKYAIVRNIGFARTCNVSIFSNALDVDLLKQAGIYEERKDIIIKFEKKINTGTERYIKWGYKEPVIGERNRNYEFIYEDLYKFYDDDNIINFSRNNHAKHGEIYKNPITKGNMLNHSKTKGIQFEDYYSYSEKEIYKKYTNFIKQFWWEKPEHFRKAHNIAKQHNEMLKQNK